jgi:hypothetical protein
MAAGTRCQSGEVVQAKQGAFEVIVSSIFGPGIALAQRHLLVDTTGLLRRDY